MRLHTPLAALVLLGSATSLPAALLFDFGPTAPTGAETNSPFHVATGSTESTWNVIGTADTSSLLYSDGSAATGLSLDLGASSAAFPTLIDLTNQPDSNNALGSVINSGIYAGKSVGRDAIYEGSGSEVRSVGFQLTGLAAGTYDIYLTTRNTNTSAAYTMTSFAAAGAESGTFDHADFLSQSLSYPSSVTGALDAWSLGANYTKLTVTIAEGQALKVAVAGVAGANQTRGFLNSAAIVAVPEPASVVSLFGGLGVLLGFRRMCRS